MTILDQLINLMLEKVEVTPVPKQELDDFYRKTILIFVMNIISFY